MTSTTSESDRPKIGNYILVGPKGNGKSSTGNKLLVNFPGHPFFNIGDSFEDGTVRIKLVKVRDSSIVGDCLGFGDMPTSERFGNMILYKNFCDGSVKEQLLNESFRFMFCIKFDSIHKPDSHFIDAVEQFIKVFGPEGVRSMVLIAIQTANALCLEEFTQVLYDTSEYKLLKKMNVNKDIPFVLWDNKQNSYPNQTETLRDEAAKVDEFVFESVRFQVIERQIESLQNERAARKAEADMEAERREKIRLQEELEEAKNRRPTFWQTISDFFKPNK